MEVMMASYPADLKYTKEHEWAKLEGKNARVGITEFAQAELGDVVFVDLPKIGARVQAMQTFGVVESVKAVSDLYAPLSGEIIEINADLAKSPELVNTDPYGKGWMIVVALSNPKEFENLLTAAQYEEFISQAGPSH
jgi:glycine cleavage system H protein